MGHLHSDWQIPAAPNLWCPLHLLHHPSHSPRTSHNPANGGLLTSSLGAFRGLLWYGSPCMLGFVGTPAYLLPDFEYHLEYEFISLFRSATLENGKDDDTHLYIVKGTLDIFKCLSNLVLKKPQLYDFCSCMCFKRGIV